MRGAECFSVIAYWNFISWYKWCGRWSLGTQLRKRAYDIRNWIMVSVNVSCFKEDMMSLIRDLKKGKRLSRPIYQFNVIWKQLKNALITPNLCILQVKVVLSKNKSPSTIASEQCNLSQSPPLSRLTPFTMGGSLSLIEQSAAPYSSLHTHVP